MARASPPVAFTGEAAQATGPECVERMGVERTMTSRGRRAATEREMRTGMRRSTGASPRGMTLIEIMVVLVILGMIAGAIGWNVLAQLKDANIKTAGLDVKAIAGAVDMYQVKNSKLPESLDTLVPGELRSCARIRGATPTRTSRAVPMGTTSARTGPTRPRAAATTSAPTRRSRPASSGAGAAMAHAAARRGFTLIEVGMALLVVAMLVGVAVPRCRT